MSPATGLKLYACSVEMACRLCIRHPRILLDINMPRMNGIEFLTELRADPTLKALSVIMLTTSNEERDKVAAYDLNVAGYILKPVEWNKFVNAVATLDMYWSLMEMAHNA